jgi:hypothetical protein
LTHDRPCLAEQLLCSPYIQISCLQPAVPLRAPLKQCYSPAQTPAGCRQQEQNLLIHHKLMWFAPRNFLLLGRELTRQLSQPPTHPRYSLTSACAASSSCLTGRPSVRPRASTSPRSYALTSRGLFKPARRGISGRFRRPVDEAARTTARTATTAGCCHTQQT